MLVDTDVLIDHLRGYSELAISSGTGRFSVVTRAELFAGPEAQLGEVERLLSALVELELSLVDPPPPTEASTDTST